MNCQRLLGLIFQDVLLHIIFLRPCEVKFAWATVEKSIRLLDYADKTTLKDGVKNLVDWAKKHGAVEPDYVELELQSERTPMTWTERLY
jgi:nucleoside-diphosphate-sugar epimerase